METIFHNLPEAKQTFNKILDLFTLIMKYLKNFKNSKSITKFDISRYKQIKERLAIIVELLNLILRLTEKFSYSKSNENFKFYIDLIIRNSIDHIHRYNNDPFQYFPDINLFLLFNGAMIGVCSLKAHDLIWSSNDQEIGSKCSQVIYSDIKVRLYNL